MQTTPGAEAAISGQIRSRRRGRGRILFRRRRDAIYEAHEEVQWWGFNSKFIAAAFLTGTERDG